MSQMQSSLSPFGQDISLPELRLDFDDEWRVRLHDDLRAQQVHRRFVAERARLALERKQAALYQLKGLSDQIADLEIDRNESISRSTRQPRGRSTVRAGTDRAQGGRAGHRYRARA